MTVWLLFWLTDSSELKGSVKSNHGQIKDVCNLLFIRNETSFCLPTTRQAPFEVLQLRVTRALHLVQQ